MRCPYKIVIGPFNSIFKKLVVQPGMCSGSCLSWFVCFFFPRPLLILPTGGAVAGEAPFCCSSFLITSPAGTGAAPLDVAAATGSFCVVGGGTTTFLFDGGEALFSFLLR